MDCWQGEEREVDCWQVGEGEEGEVDCWQEGEKV